jgi:AraC-like DNA-binding protein/tetratricopeptide (TPR) repeat protein
MSASGDAPLADETGPVPRGLARVLRAMRAAPAKTATLKDLARTAGVSTRTLQRQFQAFLSQTPVEALRTIRLEHARLELLRGAKGISVADIATRCGLPHLGRFSIEYRRRYGEKPSRTLDRSRIAVPMLDMPGVFIASGDRPTIAVTPIETHGMDPIIAREITEELVTALIRSGLAVTDRADRARYHIRGVCRPNEGQVRTLFRMLDAESGRHVWAFQQDSDTGENAHFERLALAVTAIAQSGLRRAEAERVRLKPESDLTVEELTMKAWPYATALSPEGNRRAVELLERAMDRDPEHAMAIALAAWCHAQSAIYQFADNVLEERARAVQLASRALRIGDDSPTLAVLGHALSCAHELGMAEDVTRRALQLDGSSAWAWSRSAWLEIYGGRAEAAIERFSISLDLAPRDPMVFNNYAGLGCSYLHIGRYSEAARWMTRAIANHPPAVWAHRILCPIYLLGGNRPEAERSLKAIKRLYPGATAFQCAAAAPLPKSDQDLVADGLESMGLVG